MCKDEYLFWGVREDPTESQSVTYERVSAALGDNPWAEWVEQQGIGE